MLDLCFAFEPNLWLFPDRRPRPAGAWATPVRLEVRAVRLLLLRALLVGALLLRPGLGALSPALFAGLVSCRVSLSTAAHQAAMERGGEGMGSATMIGPFLLDPTMSCKYKDQSVKAFSAYCKSLLHTSRLHC